MASALSYSSIVPSHKSEKISSITISYIFARATSRPSRRIVNLRFAQALCVAQKLSRRPQTCVAIPPLRAHYAIAQIHSDFGAGLSRETAQRAKSRLISTCLASALPLAHRLLLSMAVNEDCGSPDCFGHGLAETQGQAQSPSFEETRSRKPGAVVAMPDGSHIPVSDRTRSENRMVNDASSQSAQAQHFRKRSNSQNRISGIPARPHVSASPTALAHLFA